MWCGPEAPLIDKDNMATFERYFVEDKELHKEKKGHYYTCLLYTSTLTYLLIWLGKSGKTESG